MPELPEVETVRRGLKKTVVGHRVIDVQVRAAKSVPGSRRPADLLVGRYIVDVQRHGKRLAILTSSRRHGRAAGPCLDVHLGMTGHLQHLASGGDTPDPKHVRVQWRLDNAGLLVFRDPRRFGRVRAFAHPQALYDSKWSVLGPDALAVSSTQLLKRLARTRRSIKAALLDQHVLAGMGNIYVDELLFKLRVHPQAPANLIQPQLIDSLRIHMRTLLRRAISARGSSIRDYRDSQGRQGAYQQKHNVYGRSGQRCVICKNPLEKLRVAGRGTVYCPSCQPLGGGEGISMSE